MELIRASIFFFASINNIYHEHIDIIYYEHINFFIMMRVSILIETVTDIDTGTSNTDNYVFVNLDHELKYSD